MQPIYIADYRVGQIGNRKPIMTPVEAWTSLINGYVFRGRVKKKYGYDSQGRLARGIEHALITISTQPDGTYFQGDILADANLTQSVTETNIAADQPNSQLVPGSIELYIEINPITNITSAAQAVVTLSGNHNLSLGQNVYFNAVEGMAGINGMTGEVVNIGSPTVFTVDIDSSMFGAYTGNGYAYLVIEPTVVNYNVRSIGPIATGQPSKRVYMTLKYYPCLPVTGLYLRERILLNNEETVAFDTRYSYVYAPHEWDCLESTVNIDDITSTLASFTYTVDTDGPHYLKTGALVHFSNLAATGEIAQLSGNTYTVTVVDEDTFTVTGQFAYAAGVFTAGTFEFCQTWDGEPSDLFWCVNYDNDATPTDRYMFFATNGRFTSDTSPPAHTDYPIRYYSNEESRWVNYTPDLDDTSDAQLWGAKVMISYKERMFALYTYEAVSLLSAPSVIEYRNRIRYSQIGNIKVTGTGASVEAWWDNIAGRGGFIDVPTAEQIISASVIRDKIIIFCERSTWELIYTGDETNPFLLRRINNVQGVESKCSVVDFDNAIFGVGQTGIHACNGDSVQRIDEVIPNQVYQIGNTNAQVKHVQGIRDFYNEIVLWTFPGYTADEENNVEDLTEFPNRILVYNYVDRAWSYWDESWTFMGYFQRQSDITWAETAFTDPPMTWQNSNRPWFSQSGQSLFRNLVSGNQVGYTFFMDGNSTNCAISRYVKGWSLSADIITLNCPNHNLEVEDVVYFENFLFSTALSIDSRIGNPVYDIVDENNVQVINNAGITAAHISDYIGNGSISKADAIQWRTPFFHPGWGMGQGVAFSGVDLLMANTALGKVNFNVYMDMNIGTSLTGLPSNFGDGGDIINTFYEQYSYNEFRPSSQWHTRSIEAAGSTLMLELILEPALLVDRSIAESQIELDAVAIYVMPNGVLN